MNANEVIAQLTKEYPGAPIKRLPDDDPSEIVCEFDPKDKHPDWSMAIAVIDESKPHYHRRTTEIYRVLQGELELHVGDDVYTIYEGQEYTIVPNTVHWARGNATWIEVYCSPGYAEDDHILA